MQMIAAIKNIILHKEKNYLKIDTYLFVSICMIILCGIKVTWNLEQNMDILFWDESIYLKRGTLMFDFIPKDWGPFYSLWYKFLSVFISDNVTLYYFNFKLTTILIVLAIYLLLLSCGTQRTLAFILSLFFLASFINLPVWPRISHFCIILLLTGLVIAKQFSTITEKFIVLSIALLISAYARPEFYFLFSICFIISILLFVLSIKHRTSFSVVSFGILLLLFLATFYVYKSPFINGDSSRSIKVFLQHFAWNLANWNMVDGAYWIEFMDIDKKYFSNIYQLSSIISSNRDMFMKHIESNFIQYVVQTIKIVFNFLLPVSTQPFHWLSLMIGSMFLIIYFSSGSSLSKFKEQFSSLLKSNIFTISVLFILFLSTVFISIYAYPRAHYLILQVPFLILLIAFIFSSFSVQIEKEINKCVVLSVIWFFVSPAAEDFSYFNLFRKEESFCNLETVTYLKKKFHTKDTVSVFDLEGGLTNLLPRHFTDNNFYYTDNKNRK